MAAADRDFRSESAEERDEARGVHRCRGAAARARARDHAGSDAQSETDV